MCEWSRSASVLRNHSNQFIPGCDKFRYSSINPDGLLDVHSFVLENGYTQVIISCTWVREASETQSFQTLRKELVRSFIFHHYGPRHRQGHAMSKHVHYQQ